MSGSGPFLIVEHLLMPTRAPDTRPRYVRWMHKLKRYASERIDRVRGAYLVLFRGYDARSWWED
jgi:hypothetical protein